MNDEWLTRVERAAREPVPVDPAAVDRTIAAVRRVRARPPLLLAPRVSYAVAFAIALVAFGAGAWWSGQRAEVATAAAADANRATPVTFVLVAENAQEVAVVGDFNDWTPGATRLHQQQGGMWSVVVPLEPGRYSYAFIVDGATWLADPTAPRNLEEDFGRPSSVVMVERGSS